ncbi:hypothetical protein BY996DRAFT_7062321 [Phakopsora pachyrhizi]|nr:hypothetical protein BY996DRAFT_7062321 [Phakopsora pachyrhizi]
MKNNDNTNKRLFNEISTKFGLKRVDILGLGGKFILNILDNLKLKFDSKLKKNRAPQSGWCEIALRIIFGVSNKIILFYRIFTPFDEFFIRNLKTNLEYFFKHSERFFTNLFEYFTDNQENLTGKDPYIDQGEKKKYFNFYMNYDKIRFEYDCSKYLFAYWLNYKTTITELDEKMNYAKSPWVINFINDCSIIDFIESYKYPLKDYYWT